MGNTLCLGPKPAIRRMASDSAPETCITLCTSQDRFNWSIQEI